jgi:hypothetical protein
LPIRARPKKIAFAKPWTAIAARARIVDLSGLAEIIPGDYFALSALP